MNNVLLDVSNLHVVYDTFEGRVEAVRGISLKIKQGESLGLVGESGAGKTTTALSIMQLVPSPPGKISSGEIKFQNIDLNKIAEQKMRQIRGNRISMIFQDPMTSLNPVLPIGLQIAETIAVHQNLRFEKAKYRAQELLEKVQIPAERYKEYPHEFSGGMRQRVGIAMSLSCNPSLLVADEPTSALDVTIQAQILDLMKDLREEFDTSLILITHDLGIVADICDRVATMYCGIIVEEGTVKEVFENPLHPYTQGLFNCIPKINDKGHKILPIFGLPPSSLKYPSGCSFHPRCPKCTEICVQKMPPIQSVKGRTLRCHNVTI